MTNGLAKTIVQCKISRRVTIFVQENRAKRFGPIEPRPPRMANCLDRRLPTPFLCRRSIALPPLCRHRQQQLQWRYHLRCCCVPHAVLASILREPKEDNMRAGGGIKDRKGRVELQQPTHEYLCTKIVSVNGSTMGLDFRLAFYLGQNPQKGTSYYRLGFEQDIVVVEKRGVLPYIYIYIHTEASKHRQPIYTRRQLNNPSYMETRAEFTVNSQKLVSDDAENWIRCCAIILQFFYRWSYSSVCQSTLIPLSQSLEDRIGATKN